MASIARKAAARHAKPAQRHFAKKAPKDARDVDESSDEEHEQEIVEEENEIGTFGIDEDVESFTTMMKVPEKSSKLLKVALGNVQVEDGRVIVDGQVESGKTLVEQQVADEEEESSESESEEEESSEEESESEDEPAPKPQLRPVFVQKRAREALKEREGPAFDSEEAIKKREAAAEERRKQSRQLAGDSVKRGLEEKEAQEPGKEIDDTDGKDPEEEFQAWRMRELMRLKREKEAERQKEEERMEIERRRAMPEEQRLKEDLEHAKQLREAKPQGSGAFLQKYWHKGAFYQEADIIKNRDYSKPTESQVDISLLPKIMQVKDFGKRSRTKYTHLKDQDTTVQSAPKSGTGYTGAAPSGQGCFLCGGPHLKRDCPQNTGVSGQGPPGTGTNATGTSSSRQWGEKSDRQSDWRNRSPPPRYRSRSRDGDRYGEERRRDRSDYSRHDRRSRSPSDRHRTASRHRQKQTARPYATTNRRDSRSRSPDSHRRDDHDSKRRRLD